MGHCVAWMARTSVVLMLLLGGCGVDEAELNAKQAETAQLMPEAAARELIASMVGPAWATQPYINDIGWCGRAVIPIHYTDIVAFAYWGSVMQVDSTKLPNGCSAYIRFTFRSDLSRERAVQFKQALVALGARI